MTAGAWIEANNRYLESEIDLLRLRLLRLASAEPSAGPRPPAPAPAPALAPAAVAPAAIAPAAVAPERRRRWGRHGHGHATAAQPPAPDAPASTTSVRAVASARPTDRQLADAIARRDAAAAMDGDPALTTLSRQLGLSPFERDTLMLCAAIELAPGLGALCARANAGTASSQPTFGLALSLFDAPTWDALGADRPLRYARLLEVSQPGALALTSSPLRADERIVNYLKGRNVLDDRLSTFLDAAPDSARSSLAPSQQAVVEGILRRLHRDVTDAVTPLVQLVGVDGDARLAAAVHVAGSLARGLYRLRVESLPSDVGELETLARLWQRESLLLPIALYIEAGDADRMPGETARSLQRLLAHRIGLAFLGVREGPLTLAAANFAAEVLKPTREEQRSAWAAVLATDAPDDPALTAPTDLGMAAVLAGQFDLGLGEIEAATRMADTPDPALARPDRLWRACCDLTRPRLESLAQRLDVKVTWDDLVLPAESLELLRRVTGQVRRRHEVYETWGFARRMNRGLGISALFAGESGTGKTMAAEVIAGDLGLDLYRIDLSTVVSKYIGETEKNVARLFDAGESGGAILLFDEADALFGKRGEVKDSHDRYANIEINYLLQRIEAFTGLAILTTNMKSALDGAFMRRLRFVVNFQFPGAGERELMWRKALPAQTPVADLDFGRLARLTLTGGSIHNIALNAAFMASENGGTVTTATLMSAARMELRKLDKPFSESELRVIA